MNKSHWFYLEPYVHVAAKHRHVLLYNPLNGKALQYKDSPGIVRLLKRLHTKKNLLVVKLTEAELKQSPVSQFIGDVRAAFMGDLLDTAFSKGKPIQVPPRIKVMRKPQALEGDDAFMAGGEIKDYLTTLSFYINGYGPRDAEPLRDAHKQFLWPAAGSGRRELPLDKIAALLEEAKGSAPEQVNILGGNIFKYSKLKALADILTPLPVMKAYHVYYRDAAVLQPEDLNTISRTPDGNIVPGIEVNISVDFPLGEEAFEDALILLRRTGTPARFNFAVAHEAHIEQTDALISKFDLSHFTYHPYFNGKNLNFFKSAVYVTEEEVLESKPTQKDIFARKSMNTFFFGKLTVLNTGSIHSNINAPRLGKLGVDSLYDIMHKELYHRSSWLRCRAHVTPCRSCVFQDLCPPVSHYESVIKQNNLCHILPVETADINKQKAARNAGDILKSS